MAARPKSLGSGLAAGPTSLGLASLLDLSILDLSCRQT